MSDTHMAFAGNLNRLADGVLIAKQAMGQMLCNHALVGLIECKMPVALRQLIVEDAKEGRVGQHDGALVVAILYHPIAIFYFSTLAHHSARLLHFRAHGLDFTASLGPHKEIILIA